jgi:hypothetical protein
MQSFYISTCQGNFTHSKGDDTMSNPNLSVWDRVCVTDPAYAKDFSRAGGFQGTAINPTYLAKRATEVFGPAGLGWGINIIEEVYKEGAPIIVNNAVVGKECVHIIRAALWYVLDGKKGEVIQFGQTTFIGKNKYKFDLK